MNLKRFFGELLIMTRAERNGAIVLLLLIVVVLVIRMIVPVIIKNDDSYLAEIEQKIAQLENASESETLDAEELRIVSPGGRNKATKDQLTSTYNKQLFTFDPNTISRQELNQLGFSDKLANTVLNYREKGGTFRRNTDLLKIYGLDTAFYYKLENYISIKKDSVNQSTLGEAHNFPIQKEKLKIEINGADSASFTKLPGIGPVFAKRICTFREYLGGFVSIEQLREVYRLPPETYNKIINYLIIDTTVVEHINVNFADINELKKHPYCNYDMARRVVDYRSNSGSYSSVQKLLEDSILTSAEFAKLGPYLSVK